MLDLNLMRTFLAIYRAGSLTAAAHTLAVSQPTVTAQLRALEQRLGGDLFLRRARGVEPTNAAHELARRVAGPLDMLAVSVEADAHASALPVRLGGPSELLCARVLPALAGLVAQGLQLRVSQGLTDPLLEEMRAGGLDLVIATRRPRGRGLSSVPLVDEEYALVAAPVWLERLNAASGSDPSDLADRLRDVPLVSYAQDMPIVRRYWRTVLRRAEPPALPGLTVPNLHAVVAALVAGAGYSVLPMSLCSEHLARGTLVLLDQPEVPPLNTLFLVQRPGAEGNPAVGDVRSVLCAALKSHETTWAWMP